MQERFSWLQYNSEPALVKEDGAETATKIKLFDLGQITETGDDSQCRVPWQEKKVRA
jgi:hypothetical protein